MSFHLDGAASRPIAGLMELSLLSLDLQQGEVRQYLLLLTVFHIFVLEYSQLHSTFFRSVHSIKCVEVVPSVEESY